MVKEFNDKKYIRDINESKKVLKWGINKFYPKIAIASSFSVEDTVIIDLATKINPIIKVIYINTGFQFKETDEIKEIIKKKYELNLVEYSPLLSTNEQGLKYGHDLPNKNSDLCCKIRKVEPIKRALQDLNAWITGLRREQATTRKNIEMIEEDCRDDGNIITKINPLAFWTKKQVWNYITDNEIPYNKLYDKGYTSIGCEPCTRTTYKGEDERAGRWSGKDKIECGIHTLLKPKKT